MARMLHKVLLGAVNAHNESACFNVAVFLWCEKNAYAHLNDVSEQRLHVTRRAFARIN